MSWMNLRSQKPHHQLNNLLIFSHLHWDVCQKHCWASTQRWNCTQMMKFIRITCFSFLRTIKTLTLLVTPLITFFFIKHKHINQILLHRFLMTKIDFKWSTVSPEIKTKESIITSKLTNNLLMNGVIIAQPSVMSLTCSNFQYLNKTISRLLSLTLLNKTRISSNRKLIPKAQALINLVLLWTHSLF